MNWPKDATADLNNYYGRQLHLRNFIACVRTRQSDGLIAPPEEARQACGLAHLEEVALSSRRGFEFDPVTEVALDDEVINAYFSDQDLYIES